MGQIEQVLKLTDEVWNNINPQLRQTLNDLRNLDGYAYSQSRTLNNILNSTVFGNRYSSRINAYRVLAGICTLLTSKTIDITPKYKLITSEMANTLTLNDIYNELPTSSEQTNRIIIYHIPKGKSYLRKLLDENENLTRLKQIETFGIENPSHFLRIYKNLGNTGINDITIFTDIISYHLIYTIFVMLPNLFDINTYEINTDPAPTEEQRNIMNEHNRKVTCARQLFEYLYKIYIDNNTTYSIDNIRAEVFRITTQFASLFDFNSNRLNNFAQQLAKAKNDNAKKYLTQELNRIQSDIRTFEAKLETRYNEQLRIQQNLAATNNVTAEDVKPFIDTINNTKAIEVLAATDSEMRLRITAPLQYFTSSDFERYEKNISSAYNQRFMGGGETAILRSILHKIFVTREYRLLVQAIIKLRINTGYYDTVLSANAQAHELTDFTEFPNPHLYHHNCWSAARNEITKNLCEGNYELVVMQMVAAVQSVNVAEHASFVNGLLDDIRNSNLVRTKGLFHVIDSTGKHYTYDEIIAHETALQREDAVKAAKATLTNNPKEGYSQIEIPDDDTNWEEENE